VKVLFTCELFPPDFAGGGEYIVLQIARGLINRGVEVQVVTTGDPRISEFEGVPTLRLPVSRYGFNFRFRQIESLARDADLIQTSFYHACVPSVAAARRLGKPIVGLVLGLFQEAWYEMKPRPLGGLWSVCERFVLTRNYTKLVFLSNGSKTLGVRLGFPEEKAEVICPGIDLESYRPSAAKEDVVFFTAKLDVRKGIYDLLQVARAMPAVRFRVMGWGPDEEKVKRLASPNVEFVDFPRGMPGVALRKAFADARIFFFPSKSETFGLAILEAMASGCAVISSVPLPFAGIQIKAGDHDAMIAAIAELWADPEMTARMGQRNMEVAQRFTWDRYIDELLAVYRHIIPGCVAAPTWRPAEERTHL
jgi:glycosyltransferase involved in cell wall biosynthesis